MGDPTVLQFAGNRAVCSTKVLFQASSRGKREVRELHDTAFPEHPEAYTDSVTMRTALPRFTLDATTSLRAPTRFLQGPPGFHVSPGHENPACAPTGPGTSRHPCQEPPKQELGFWRVAMECAIPDPTRLSHPEGRHATVQPKHTKAIHWTRSNQGHGQSQELRGTRPIEEGSASLGRVLGWMSHGQNSQPRGTSARLTPVGHETAIT